MLFAVNALNNNWRYEELVNSYVKYLPSYPPEYINYLKNQGRLPKDAVVTDIGSGVGILAELISPHVKTVLAVEPDEKMRWAAAAHQYDTENITIINGSAEDTGLESNTVDLITVGQAFHYFDITSAHTEFQRILKPGGKVALAWHIRRTDYPFGREYEALLKTYCPGYLGTGGQSTATSVYHRFFKNGNFEYLLFKNHRLIDRETFIGYSLSMPFTPVREDENFTCFIDQLSDIFKKYSENGKLEIQAYIESYIGGIKITE